jgi:hypothetical protein
MRWDALHRGPRGVSYIVDIGEYVYQFKDPCLFTFEHIHILDSPVAPPNPRQLSPQPESLPLLQPG